MFSCAALLSALNPGYMFQLKSSNLCGESFCFCCLALAPHQPRLDWQMWFAALESYSENPWFLSLIHKLLLGKQDVLQLLGEGPFDKSPPQFIRAQLYLYHYTQNTSSLWEVLTHPR